MKKLGLTSLFLLNFVLPAAAADNVAIFKNGTAFFIKELNLETKNKSSTISELPDALFGTIWFTSPGNPIKSVLSETRQLPNKIKAGNLTEIISANIGKSVRLSFHSGEALQGRINRVENDLLFFRQKEHLLSFSISSVKMVEFLEEPSYEFSKNEAKKTISLEFAGPSSRQKVNMMYMQRDIGWAPSYFIDLISNDKARISLTANVINDVEDLENTDLQLVVGVPNFAYSYLKSPLTSTQPIADFLRTLENQGTDNTYSRSSRADNIMTQSTANFEPADGYTLPNADISAQEDLYFYKLPKVKLKKAERAIFELFKADISYEHIYEAELETNQNRNYHSNQEGLRNNELPRVWHSVRLNNSTGYPFTTGTAMVVKTEAGLTKPVSQDKLNYTPVNGKTKLKLTVSPDISVRETEKETSRSENLKLGDNYYYDLLNIEAKISIKNNKNQPVKLNINRIIEGKLGGSSHKWNSSVLNIYKTQNPVNQVEWDIDLRPGEAREITYKYTNYLRR